MTALPSLCRWAALIAAVLTPSGTIAAEGLSSYEAFYDVRLTRSGAAHGPRVVVGSMSQRFTDVCTGWETRSRTVLNLTFRDGTIFVNERQFASWEAKNGADYTFQTQTTKNGISVEAFTGRAQITADGGTATYEGITDPTVKYVMQLPARSMLPVAYMHGLIDHAQRGEKFFQSVVFNGASSDGPRLASAVIGPRLASDAMGLYQPATLTRAGEGLDQALLGTPAWRFSIAMFNVNEKRDLPNFEMSVLFHRSGVARSFTQDFGDFAVAAELKHLRRLDPPNCPTP